MHLYRNKDNNLLYVLERIIVDINHTNRGGFTGVKAYPYKHNGEVLTHLKDQQGSNFNPDKFINNFTKVSEL